MKRVSDKPMVMLSVRVTQEQKEYLDKNGGSKLLRDILDWEIQCAKKEQQK